MSERFLPCARCKGTGVRVWWTGSSGSSTETGGLCIQPGETIVKRVEECPECGPKIDPRCAPGCRREVREEPLEGIEKAADALMKDPK